MDRFPRLQYGLRNPLQQQTEQSTTLDTDGSFQSPKERQIRRISGASPQPPVGSHGRVDAKLSPRSPKPTSLGRRIEQGIYQGQGGSKQQVSATSHLSHVSGRTDRAESNDKARNNNNRNQHQHQQQEHRDEIRDYQKDNYIESLESHVEAQERDKAAWKLRYYVELFRLIASRNLNKQMRDKAQSYRANIEELEKHALELSRQNAYLLKQQGDEGLGPSLKYVMRID